MRPISIIALSLALLVLPSRPAFAGLPFPGDWIIPSHVTLVGVGPAGPDSAIGHVICVIRDLAHNPIPGSVVVLDFSACTDLAIASDQSDPRLFTNCATRSVYAVTDVNGIARFTVVGTGTNGPVHPSQSLHIFADGVLAGSASVAVLERDGAGGLTLADLAYWADDFFSGSNAERADLSGENGVTISDLSMWAAAYFSGNNAFPAGPYCP